LPGTYHLKKELSRRFLHGIDSYPIENSSERAIKGPV
jgi:hypothetical protein